MFTNYSQTYAAQISTLGGFIVLLLNQLGYNFLPGEVEIILGSALNFFGVIWTLYHRYSKGDVTVGGARKN